MRLFVTRDLTFWHFHWHFGMCEQVIRFESDDMTSARAVRVGQSLSKIERPPNLILAGLWQLAEENLSFTSSLSTFFLRVFLLIKKGMGFRLLKIKPRGYSFFFKLSVKYQAKKSWLLFYFQAVIVLNLHKNYFILSLITILIIAIGHVW